MSHHHNRKCFILYLEWTFILGSGPSIDNDGFDFGFFFSLSVWTSNQKSYQLQMSIQLRDLNNKSKIFPINGVCQWCTICQCLCLNKSSNDHHLPPIEIWFSLEASQFQCFNGNERCHLCMIWYLVRFSQFTIFIITTELNLNYYPNCEWNLYIFMYSYQYPQLYRK